MPGCRNCGYLIDELDWDNTRRCPRCGEDPHQVTPPRQQEKQVFDPRLAAIPDPPSPGQAAPGAVLRFAEYARKLGIEVRRLLLIFAGGGILSAILLLCGPDAAPFAAICGGLSGIFLWAAVFKMVLASAFGLSAAGRWLLDQYEEGDEQHH